MEFPFPPETKWKMASFLTNDLARYLPRHAMPLYVEGVARGAHPERKFHGHTFMELVLVQEGSGLHLIQANPERLPQRREKTPGHEYASEIQAGDVLLIYPGVSHSYDRTETLGLVNLVYDPRKLALPLLDGEMMPLFDRLFTPRRTINPELVVRPLLHLPPAESAALSGKIAELSEELQSNRPGRNFYSAAIFMEIIVTLCRSGDTVEEAPVPEFLIGDAIRYMHDHLSEPIEIEDLLGVVHMSRRNFFRRFHSATGCTPHAYLKDLRFSHATRLLCRTDLSITEIALKSGFCDGNYLCRLCRERTGMTARRFRDANRSSPA